MKPQSGISLAHTPNADSKCTTKGLLGAFACAELFRLKLCNLPNLPCDLLTGTSDCSARASLAKSSWECELGMEVSPVEWISRIGHGTSCSHCSAFTRFGARAQHTSMTERLSKWVLRELRSHSRSGPKCLSGRSTGTSLPSLYVRRSVRMEVKGAVRKSALGTAPVAPLQRPLAWMWEQAFTGRG